MRVALVGVAFLSEMRVALVGIVLAGFVLAGVAFLSEIYDCFLKWSFVV
jgi:hypothetical protein